MIWLRLFSLDRLSLILWVDSRLDVNDFGRVTRCTGLDRTGNGSSVGNGELSFNFGVVDYMLCFFSCWIREDR